MAIDVKKADLADEAIRTGSGKGWQEWVDLLDAWGGRDRTHTEIARHVVSLGVDGWWAQGVTVGYERIIGRRVTGQRSDGRFSGSASATFPVGADRLTALLVEDDERRTWLVPDTLTVRTVQPGKSARFDQADSAGILAAWLTDKGPDKCSVQVQEEGFPSKEAADAFRATWKARFAALRAHIESSTA